MAILGLLSNVLLLVATIGLGLYCRTLSNRLNAPAPEEPNIDQKLASLEAMISESQSITEQPKFDASEQLETLSTLLENAENRIGQLEMLIAGLEDIEDSMPGAKLDIADTAAPIIPTFRAQRPVTAERGNP